MSLLPIEYLKHIIDETEYIETATRGIRRDKFIKDETLKRAVVRSIEIIGEAVKQIPDELRQKYSHIDWRSMAGMRDRLIHGYMGVDYDIVWDVVINKVPTLKREIREIINDIGR